MLTCSIQCSIALQSPPTRYARSLRLTYRLSQHVLQYVVGSFACIGGGLFGLDISSMSGVLSVRIHPTSLRTTIRPLAPQNVSYQQTFHFPGPSAQGAIVAAMPAGSFVGALAVTQLADRIGRKRTIIISGIFWVIGSILQCASVNRAMLVVGRIISGLAVGLASAVVPIYQAEITAPGIRGRIVSLQQWSITWGILIRSEERRVGKECSS